MTAHRDVDALTLVYVLYRQHGLDPFFFDAKAGGVLKLAVANGWVRTLPFHRRGDHQVTDAALVALHPYFGSALDRRAS